MGNNTPIATTRQVFATKRRLQANGMFIINRVWTLNSYLETALGEEVGASYEILNSPT